MGSRKDALEPCQSNAVLDWSSKQGRILTANNNLSDLYQASRGFPYVDSDLPHYHLINGTTRRQFLKWYDLGLRDTLIAGAWTRPLFVGLAKNFEHSTNEAPNGERVYNLQTPSIFIDIRIPHAGNGTGHTSLSTMSVEELRCFARRHAFAGYSVVGGTPAVCVRHHAIDWNFVGKPRNRPNKWRIEMDDGEDVWKEWSWAKDDHGQHVYMERWKRLPAGKGPYLALRRISGGEDAFLVVCGDHFNYIRNRPTPAPRNLSLADESGLISFVDGLVGNEGGSVSKDDRRLIEQYLSLEAGHGLVSSGWTIDAALHPWQEGTELMKSGDIVMMDDGRTISWGEHGIWRFCERTCSMDEAQRILRAARTPQSRL